MKLFNIFSKPKEPNKPKNPKPVRISVHHNGVTCIHWACFITKHNNGNVTLHDTVGGGYIVAEYANGSWSSISIGKRAVSRGVPVNE